MTTSLMQIILFKYSLQMDSDKNDSGILPIQAKSL